MLSIRRLFKSLIHWWRAYERRYWGWPNQEELPGKLSDQLFYYKYNNIPADYRLVAEVDKLENERDALQDELQLYREALESACEAVQDWGAYASEYCQNKWDWWSDCRPETHLQTARDNLKAKER